VKTFHNVCGLASILGQTSANNQVSLTIKERSARCHGAPTAAASEKFIAIDMLHKTPCKCCVRPYTTYFNIESLRVRLYVVQKSYMLFIHCITYKIFHTTYDKNLRNI